jgi:hypothetical protein
MNKYFIEMNDFYKNEEERKGIFLYIENEQIYKEVSPFSLRINLIK